MSAADDSIDDSGRPVEEIAHLDEEHALGRHPVVLPEDAETMRALPQWVRPLVDVARTVDVHALTRFPPPPEGGRRAAVLVLVGELAEHGPDVLLIERAHDMRSHSGQPAFPGGAVDDGDGGAVSAAVREAVEETGVDPAGVRPFAVLPDLYLPPSGFVVSPVLAWWASPSPVAAVDPIEVATVHRVPWGALADPRRRVRVRHPSGFVGPGFEVADLLVWGFTAGVLDRLLALTGWEQPWSADRVVDITADGRVPPSDDDEVIA